MLMEILWVPKYITTFYLGISNYKISLFGAGHVAGAYCHFFDGYWLNYYRKT